MSKKNSITAADLTTTAKALLAEIEQIAESHRRYCGNSQAEKDGFGEILYESCALGIVEALYPVPREIDAWNTWRDIPHISKLLSFLYCSARLHNPRWNQAITDAGLAKIHGKILDTYSIWSILSAKQSSLFEEEKV